ncbi:ZN831 protein, partial [Rhinopomastus cyanomelas]|nr:ZN831 protein [Rhinopomastus cyanomelas]
TSASCKDVEPTAMGWDRGGSPHNLKDIPPSLRNAQRSQSSADSPTNFCCSSGTFCCHTVTTHCEVFPALLHKDLTCCSGSCTVPSSKGTFPSLNAEPQLTWCCLTRSLPLPVEQKGSADSAYSSMHSSDKEPSSDCRLSKCNVSIFKMKNTSKTVACGLTNKGLKTVASSFSKGQQMQELSSAAPGVAFKNTSELKKKTVV